MRIIFILLFFIGCAPIIKDEKEEVSPEEKKEYIDKYEKTFDPSEYDEDVIERKDENLADLRSTDTFLPDTAVSEPEFISGFRIQISMTTDIDEANQLKNELLILLEKEWAYVIFEAPYYKIRVGNFTDRLAANHILKDLIGYGYKNAWIVPDKVYKNPPEKSKEPDIRFEEN